jgi:hypothetical protein
MSWGTIRIGRFYLRETFTVEESINAATRVRSLKISGQESSPPLTRDEVYDRRDALLGSKGSTAQIEFVDKPEINGYFTIYDANAVITDYQSEVTSLDWSIVAEWIGADNETDLESRLTTIVRLNDFTLTGERWHAPSIGHYSYHTGATLPSTMTRTTDEGAMTIYRGVPADVNPRWGCAVANYPKARVRIEDGNIELAGTDVRFSSVNGIEISNGLVNFSFAPSGSGSVIISSYDGTQWENKNWNLTIDGGAALPRTIWNSATVIRNELEHCIVRFIGAQGPGALGRVQLDVSLRRGSRFVEFYLRRSSSASLSAHLTSAETKTDFLSGGYTVATNNDAAGNRATAGTARTFTAHANLGITKASTTTLDFYLGAVIAGGSAVSGDQASNLRDQYIAAMPELVTAVWR